MNARKSQVSTEFLFAVGIIVFIFITLLVFIFARQVDVRSLEEQTSLLDTCEKISSILTASFINGHGLIIQDKTAYDLDINADSQVISAKDNLEVFCTIPFNQVENENGNSDFTIQKGNIEIKNEEGVVTLKNV